jgi:hypothetical protein
MIGCGDTVTVNGEGDIVWEVDMAGDASQMVRIIRNRDAATWRMIDRAGLVLVSKAAIDDDSPRLMPARGILD